MKRFRQRTTQRDVITEPEASRMVNFAQVLRADGWKGHRLSASVLDRVLIYAESFEHMVALVDLACELCEQEDQS